MKLAASVLLSSLLCLSVQSYANQDEIPGPVLPQVAEHVPESCAINPSADKANPASDCAIDKGNSELLRELKNLFSKKKGNVILFTTEHVEEILAKMREMKITQEEWIAYKTDSTLCVKKLMPVLELIAKHAEMPLDQELIDTLCANGSFIYRSLSSALEFAGFASKNPGPTAGILLGLAGGGLGWYREGTYRAGVSYTVAVLAVFMGGRLTANLF